MLKKTAMKKLDEIKEKEKLPEENKNRLKKIIMNNLIFAIDIVILSIIFLLMPRLLDKNLNRIIFTVSSFVFLLYAIVLCEIAYFKDKSYLTIHTIEMLVLSIIVLLSKYIFLETNNIYFELFGIYFAIYYLIKCFIIYKKEESNYRKSISDISEIVKKESKDKLKNQKTKRKTRKSRKRVK